MEVDMQENIVNSSMFQMFLGGPQALFVLYTLSKSALLD
jgi:hypothetical protein